MWKKENQDQYEKLFLHMKMISFIVFLDFMGFYESLYFRGDFYEFFARFRKVEMNGM